MDCSTPGFPVHYQLLEFAQTYVCGVHNDLQPSHPLFPTPPLALKFSLYHGLSDELAFCIRWSKGWSFSFSISPSSEGLISFRIDWFDLLAVQGTLESLLQHHSSKVSVLQRSAFFMDQLSYPYMTTGKTIALTIWTFVSKWCPCFLIHSLGWS